MASAVADDGRANSELVVSISTSAVKGCTPVFPCVTVNMWRCDLHGHATERNLNELNSGLAGYTLVCGDRIGAHTPR